MKKPFMVAGSIPASGTLTQPGDIPLVRARTLSVTVRLKFHASATKNATVYLYYSPDGSNWDTIPYTSFDLTLSAGEYVQRTVPIDVPEHGYIKVAVANNDTSYAISDVKAWYTIQSWGKEPARGVITRDVFIEEEKGE